MFAVTTRLTLKDIRKGIAREYMMRGYSPPVRVLRAICERQLALPLAGEGWGGGGS